MVDKSEIEELLPFLSIAARLDIKKMALEYFKSLTGSNEGIDFISQNIKFFHAILNLRYDENSEVCEDAIIALINLTVREKLCNEILSDKEHPNFISDSLTCILNSNSAHADQIAMLISNITRFQDCCGVVLDVMQENESLGIYALVEAFCCLNFNSKADLHYIGQILSNLTQVKQARLHILDRSRCVIQKLLAFIEYKDSVVRRAGVVRTLKNCCFETEFHEWLLSKEVDILPTLVLPLAGPEEFSDEETDKLPIELQYLEPTKTREPDPEIRKTLIESINLLCSLKTCRLKIKDSNIYLILREYHKWETDVAVRQTLENLIQVLIADEPEPGLENLHDVSIPEKVSKQLTEADQVISEEALNESSKCFTDGQELQQLTIKEDASGVMIQTIGSK